jgi:hypothetical protein
MCWSLQASIITWVVGLVAGMTLLSRHLPNDLTLGILILTYSSMQLWEALMWYDQKCGKVNVFATQMAYYALYSHVLAIGIGLFLEKRLILPLSIGFMVLAFGILNAPYKWTCSVPGKNKHLAWGFDAQFYVYVFAIAIILCLYYIKPLTHSVIISFLFISSFLLCLIYSESDNYGPGKSVMGSFWCWVCAAFSFLFVVLPLHA